MEAVNIPWWINLGCVALAFILIYLLAKFNRETKSAERKAKGTKPVEASIEGKVLYPEKKPVKKAA